MFTASPFRVQLTPELSYISVVGVFIECGILQETGACRIFAPLHNRRKPSAENLFQDETLLYFTCQYSILRKQIRTVFCSPY